MKIFIAILICLFVSINTGYSQYFEWAQTHGPVFPATGGGNAKSICVDGTGNTYVAGEFIGSITIGSTPTLTTSSAYPDQLYISKFDNDGTALWSYKIDANGEVFDIACDNSGNFYIVGTYYGPATFGTTTFPGSGGYVKNIFVAKYNNAGTCLWATTSIGFASQYAGIRLKIVADNSGNCYIGGSFKNTLTFGNNSVSTTRIYIDEDVFIAKFSSTGLGGNCEWIRTGTSSEDYGFNSDQFSGIAIHPSGSHVYITGNMFGTQTFDTKVINFIPSQWGKAKIFYVRYNSSGTPDLAVADNEVFDGNDGGEGTNGSFGIGVDYNFNVYIMRKFSLTRYNSGGNLDKRTYWNGYIGIYRYTDFDTDDNGNSYIHSYFQGTLTFPPFSITYTESGKDNTNIFVAKYDDQCDIQWVTSAGGSSQISSGLAADQTGHAYISGGCGASNFGSNAVNAGAYVSKISPDANIIAGLVFKDENRNDSYDNLSDPLLPNVVVSVSDNSFVNSGPIGDYFAYTDATAQTLRIPYPPLYYDLTPPSILIAAAPLPNYSFSNYLGLKPQLNKNDLRITITGVGRTRPGSSPKHIITYENIGTTNITPLGITLSFNSELQHLRNTSTPQLNGGLGNSPLTWTFPVPLAPNDRGTIEVEYSIDENAIMNTLLTSTATIISPVTDETPLDNNVTINQIVTNSYDPNDKNVEPSGNLTLQNVLNQDQLTYTIRFQNTGNDTAINIRITDSISSKLQIGSVETIASSHDYKLKIKDNILIWSFNNIMLPDSTTNEPKSHGFVKFKIRPKNDLMAGNEITNSANIYFDFNEPVITNTTTNLITGPSKYIDLKYRLQNNYPILDTIRVYLANSVAPFQIIDSSTVFPGTVSSKYNAFPKFTNAVLGSSYYIVVKHRNTIDTWSATTVTFSSDTVAYDFTTSITKAFGNNMRLVSGSPIRFGFYGGDVNRDGLIDLSDVSTINNSAANFATGYIAADLNGDGIVDLTDLNMAQNNGNFFISVIRP